MSSEERLKSDVSAWILDWVSVHNDKLGHVPCPFAKQALVNDRIHWIVCDDAEHISNHLYALMELGLPKEVVVIGCARTDVTAKQLAKIVKHANHKWLLPGALVALEDHPDDPEVVAGESMNQGSWALVLVQETAKLNAASQMLQRQGYYDSWTQAQIDDVVSWRFNHIPDQR